MRFGRIILVLGIMATLAFSVIGVPSEPAAPQRLTYVGSSRFEDSNYVASIYAEAGNLTELTLYGMSQTQAWQGYFGEITGMLTLDDANNYTMYDWYMAEPQGEIYAVYNSPITDWSTAHCFNYTNDGQTHTYSYDGGASTTTTTNVWNLSEIEIEFGFIVDDYDGVDETFNETGIILNGDAHKEFFVGTINISAGSCPATNTYQLACINMTSVTDEHEKYTSGNYVSWTWCNGTDYSPQSFQFDSARGYDNDYQEVLLTVNDTETVIFTTIIENDEIASDGSRNETDVYGFDNVTHDFQMLVLEDGHVGPQQDQQTLYYFYVELE